MPYVTYSLYNPLKQKDNAMTNKIQLYAVDCRR